jgi:hypothetical protein
MLNKIIIIIIFLILFYYIINVNIEKLVGTKNYTNTNEYLWDRNKIMSQLPYDIKLKNNKSKLYDYGNDELNEKFNKVFKIDNIKLIKIIEGIEWSNKWVTNYTNKKYYNHFLKYFKNIIKMSEFDLPNDTNKFDIIKSSFVRYKTNKINPEVILLDVEVLIYRKNKPLARHIKIITVTNGIYNNVIFAKVIGVVNQQSLDENVIETDIKEHNYEIFEPEYKHIFDMNSYIYDTDEKLTHSEIEYKLYNKLLKDL